MNAAREHIEYVLTKGFFSVLRICPSALLYGVCRSMAGLFYLLAPRRRKITLTNLAFAFPERTKKEHRKIARAAYDNVGQMLAESAMVLSKKIQKPDLLTMIDGSAMQSILELEKSHEKGILIITGHVGNFELLGHYCGTQFVRQSHAVARESTNKRIDRQLVIPMRQSFGNQVIHKDRALPRVARALRNNEHVGLLIDIKSSARHGVPVQFFGNPTHAINSSAYLQTKLNPIVVPMAMVRTAPRHYKLITAQPIEWIDNGRPIDEQIQELTQIHQNELEKLIRAYPEQWFWMHDRWKRPELERTRRKKRRAKRKGTP